MISKSAFIGQHITDINKHYSFEDELGSGAYGKVFRVKDLTTGKFYACKRMNKIQISDITFTDYLFRKEVLSCPRAQLEGVPDLLQAYAKRFESLTQETASLYKEKNKKGKKPKLKVNAPITSNTSAPCRWSILSTAETPVNAALARPRRTLY